MPFKYDLSLGASVSSGAELTFESWVEDVWNRYHEEHVAFAILRGPRGLGKAYTNGVCALLEHAPLRKGDTVNSDTVLGIASADGESIPYGKPYSVFRYDDENGVAGSV